MKPHEVSAINVAQAVVLKSVSSQQHELLQLQAAEAKVVFDSVEVRFRPSMLRAHCVRWWHAMMHIALLEFFLLG